MNNGRQLLSKAARRVARLCKTLVITLGLLPAGFAFSQAEAQTISCANPVGIPILPPQFNNWGPAAVCSTASAATSLNAVISTVNTVFLTQTSAFVASPTDRAPNTMGGGVWIRGIGGRTDFSATGTATAVGLPIPVNLALTADGRARSEFGGFQAGADFARFNLNAWNLHFGITAGYMHSENTDLLGTSTSEFDIPFVGIYAVAVNASGFFADLMLRSDFYQNSVSNPLVGLANQPFDARGVSLTGSAGQRFDIVSNVFLEPSVGFVWSNVSVDSIAVPGGGPFGVPPGTSTFDNINSFLGRAGLRLGTNVSAGAMTIQPFVAANVWHEFAGNSTSQFTCTGCGFALDLSTTRVGTYGQFGAGFAAAIPASGWFAYVRGDYRTGDNIEGWGVNAGLRYQWDQGPVVVARY